MGDLVGSDVMNLLKETLQVLQEANKSPADVQWVQWEQFFCSWPEFAAAANFEYDPGYGGAEVVVSLKVVGSDWWLERGEYDGSEWWDFKTLPTKPDIARVPVEEDLHDV
jgi:hypothetical protein